MKIIIHSLDELLELAALVDDRRREREVRTKNKIDLGPSFGHGNVANLRTYADAVVGGVTETEGLPTDIAQPVGVATPNEPDPGATDGELPKRDADGVAHNTDWHSEPAKINADGRWRARRKRDEDAYKAWLLEQAVEGAEAAIAADEAEPVATETHALPQDKCWDEGCVHNEVSHQCVVPQEPGSEPSAAPATPASNVDLEALIAASLEAAQDASDSHVDLLNACRDFTSKHGHPAFTALKAAVAPDDAGGGKAVQHFTPGERRLMQACIANYPSKEA
jgi:hypothetical protein